MDRHRYATKPTASPNRHAQEGRASPPSGAPPERGYEWVALSVTTVGALLASLQGSSLIIALPDVLTGLGASFLTVMWVLLGYLLITTALVPVVGRAADIFGRKRMYVAGFAVFTVGSLLGGLAQPQFHGWDLVAYRLLQGISGALLITNSTAIVADAFRSGRVGLGLGVNQVAGAAGFLLGPVVGGWTSNRDLVALGVSVQRAAWCPRHRFGCLAAARAGVLARAAALRLAGQRHVCARHG